MLESLWFQEEKRGRLIYCFLFAVIFTGLAIFLTYFLMPFYEGLVCVFVASLAAAYPITRYIREHEEEELIKDFTETGLLRRHSRELEIYLSFFHGSLLAFIVAAIIMPPTFFKMQAQTIEQIFATGMFSGGHMAGLIEILANNMRLFALTFFLSFFITAGVIFILVWNASVLGVFLAKISQTIWDLPLLTIVYLPHGFFEIAGYVLAGLAGGLLSHHFEHFVLEKNIGKRRFRMVWLDIVLLLAFGIFSISFAGLIEVYL